ncbi:MAG: HAMP domain-containing histidine kinase [Acidimicrobiaceae bacterium]|nr:HAMP domain-containing histidine kinase [Acidimicrobiaceae bacterium]
MRSPLSVRTRLTLLFVSLVTLLLVVVNLLINSAQQSSTLSRETNVVTAELAKVVYSVTPRIVAGRERVVFQEKPPVVVQVVNLANRTVWASSANVADLPPIAHFEASATAPNGLVVVKNGWVNRSFLSGELGVSRALLIPTPRGQAVAYAFYFGSVNPGPTGVFGQFLLIRLLLEVLVAVLLVWLAVGRAMRPIESIRRRVAAIATGDLSERIPVPAGDDVVSRTAITLNEMLSRLESNTRAQQEFLSNASHELRSPLTTLLATVDRAASVPERADWGEVTAVVRREGLRLSALVDDLFWLARSDEGGIEMRREEVDIDEVLEEEARRIRQMSGLHVDSSLVEPVRVWGDPGLLRRMVRNVTENASRFARSTVSLRSYYERGDVVIEIHNDGVAVDVANSARLFQRFVRTDSSRSRNSGGTGLGLTIVADIAGRHGGGAGFVESSEGTTLQIRLRRY